MRDDGDGVVATLADAGCKADHPAEFAGRVAGLRVARKTGQALNRQRQRVAVRIADLNGDLQHRAPVNKGVAQILDLGRAVGIADHDGQRDLARQRRAAAIAVIGGGDRDAVGAGLGIARRPDQLQRLGVEAGAVGQAGDGVADRGHAGASRRNTVGMQAHLGLKARVVRIEGEQADAQRLAFQHRPGLRRIEDRCAIGVLDIERQLTLHRGGRLLAVRCGEDGLQRQCQLEQAGLRIARAPREEAGGAVQGGAGRQPRGAPGQRNPAAIGLLQTAGHRAGQLQRKAVAFKQHLRVERRKDRARIALRYGEVETALHLVLAVAGDDGDVAVLPGLVVARRPAQQPGTGIKEGAGRQVADLQCHGVAIGVGGQQRQLQAFALGQGQIAQGGDDRHMVGPRHCHRKAAQRHTAPAVDHAHQHLGIRAVGGLGRPLQRGAVAVTAGAAFYQRVLLDAQARRRADDLPIKQAAVRIQRTQRRAPSLAGLGSGQGRRVGVQAAISGALAQHRRRVVVRHGINTMAQVELDQRATARRAAKAAGRAHADGLLVQRLAVFQRLAGQCRAQVNHPQLTLLALALAGVADRVAKVAARVQQQHQRTAQVVDADVGEGHVVADRARQAVSAGVGKAQRDKVGDVGDRREHQVIRGAQRHLLHAAQRLGHLNPPPASGQVGQGQHGAFAGSIPAHAVGVQQQVAVGAGGEQAEVGRVQYRANARCVVAGRTRPHRLVKADGQLG